MNIDRYRERMGVCPDRCLRMRSNPSCTRIPSTTVLNEKGSQSNPWLNKSPLSTIQASEIWRPIPQATVRQRMAFRSADSPTAMPTSKRKPRIPVKRCMELKGLFLHVIFDVFDDGFSRRPGEENLINADCLESWNILIGNDTSGDD